MLEGISFNCTLNINNDIAVNDFVAETERLLHELSLYLDQIHDSGIK